MISVMRLGIMTINGLWRFGYYKIYSGMSMKDIPVGFNITMESDDIPANAVGEDINGIISKDDFDDSQNNTARISSLKMRTFNPIATVLINSETDNTGNSTSSNTTTTKNMIYQQQDILNQSSQESKRVVELESQLSQNNAILSECLNRLAQFEKIISAQNGS
jgi:hypothetical protein